MNVEKKKVKIIDFGFPTDQFLVSKKEKIKKLKKLKLSSRHKIFCYVGNIYKFSSLDELINIFPKFFKINKDLILFIFGSGDKRDYLEKLTKKLELSNNVIFTGSVDFNEVIKLGTNMCLNLYKLEII